MDTYDTAKMRKCAEDIDSELTRGYYAAKRIMDDTIQNLKEKWKDTTNQAFSGKYYENAEPAATNLGKIMEAYVTLLEESSGGVRKVHERAETDMR